MDNNITCIAFPFYWTEERMSLKVDVMRKVAYSDHSKLIGEASVILAKEMIGKRMFSKEYTTKLVSKKLEWLELHEGFEVTDDDLKEACDEVVEKVWDE